jgi:hypothetical protein
VTPRFPSDIRDLVTDDGKTEQRVLRSKRDAGSKLLPGGRPAADDRPGDEAPARHGREHTAMAFSPRRPGAAVVLLTAALTGLGLAAAAPAFAGSAADHPTASTAGTGENHAAVRGHPAVPEHEVATVTAAGVTLTFLSGTGPDGRSHVAMREHGSIRTARSPVAGLVAQRLTPLEIYLALAAPGAAAPADLVGVQATEAARLGRDPAVRTARVDSTTFAPLSVPDCRATVLTGDHQWYDESDVTYPSGHGLRYVGEVADFEATNMVAFGACNDTAATMTVSYAINKRWQSDGWIPSSLYPLGPGGYYVWYYSYGGYKNGVARGASYRITADGNGAYHLVTGVSWSGL